MPDPDFRLTLQIITTHVKLYMYLELEVNLDKIFEPGQGTEPT